MSKRAIYSAVIISVLLFILPWAIPLPAGLFPPRSTVVRYSNGRPASIYLAADEQLRIFTSYERLPEELIESILIKEDRYFFYHPGFNPVSLIKAALRYIKAGRIINGGSTITMQLARICEPKERTIPSKICEILRAIQFEIRFSKKDILEMYLNLAPFGGNNVGAAAGAMRYFGTPIEELDLPTAAALANLPQIPGIDLFKHPDLIKRKRNRILKDLYRKKKISKDKYTTAVNSSLMMGYYALLRGMPHISDEMRLSYPGSDTVTTIERGKQEFCQSVLGKFKTEYSFRGITNASVIVIEKGSGKIVSAVGSMDYYDSSISGQVRGYSALRQPGSTLKPFLYASALDDGIITPDTVLLDIPTVYGSFSPSNFSGEFSGLVKAEFALSNSLNIPFVRLLHTYGIGDFIEKLRDGGISTLSSRKGYYGLSLILGACDINLMELTDLYRALANDGNYSRASFLENDIEDNPVGIFSSGAVYLTSQALSIKQNPDIPSEFSHKHFVRKICWKTGTSQNYKDAWTIGYGEKYVVGVWSGNFNGASSQDLIGVAAAAPIFFEIMEGLEGRDSGEVLESPEDLKTVEICSLSGKIITDACTDMVLTQIPKNAHFAETCDLHKKYLIEKKSGLRITSIFPELGELEVRKYVQYPPQVKDHLYSGSVLKDIPPVHPKCVNRRASGGIKIISPVSKRVYRGSTGGVIPLKAVCRTGRSTEYFWFIDGEFIMKTTPAEDGFWELKKGEHRIEVTDDLGGYFVLDFVVL